MKILKIGDELNQVFFDLIQSSSQENTELNQKIAKIIKNTKENGDKALISYSNQFDQTNFSDSSDLRVTQEEIDLAEQNLDDKIKKSLEVAYKRIASYHTKQLPKDFLYEDEIGVELGNIWKNIQRVGVYVPGGTASYPSSVLMSCIPALIAKVKDIVITAPTSGGKINDAVLYAAKICGITEIYKIGGAQSIAALAYGTNSIKKVDKIVGPGNSYVAGAKKVLFGEVGIDMIAGPTDVTIICDSTANAKFIAADALSQMEHGTDSQAFVITDNEEFAHKIIREINNLKEKLNRKEIIEKSLLNSAIFIVDNLENAPNLVNQIAPEHLEIACENPKRFLDKINNAGAIFLGNYTPESIGDYIAGPSHTLPTQGSAKFSSGLSVFDFLKRVSVISCNKDSFNKLADDTINLAESEGLDAHALSIKVRK